MTELGTLPFDPNFGDSTPDDIIDTAPAEVFAVLMILEKLRATVETSDGLPDSKNLDDLSPEQVALYSYTLTVIIRIIRYMHGMPLAIVFLELLRYFSGDFSRRWFFDLSDAERGRLTTVLDYLRNRLIDEGSV
jgi:hypothetical protein